MCFVVTTDPERHDSPLSKSLGLPTFGGPTATVTLLDGDNFNFVTIKLHGLTDPLSDKQAGKWGHIGDRSAAGIRLIFAYDPERLAAIIVPQDCDLGAERNYDRVARFRLRNRARDALREIAYIRRGQFESAPTIVGVRYRLSGLERLLAVGEVRSSAADWVTRLGCAEIARRGKLTSWAVSALSSRTNATLRLSPDRQLP